MESLARRSLQAARAALRSLDDLASPEGVSLSGEIISHHLGVAMNELNVVDRQMPPDLAAQPEAERVPCAYCGNMIMPTATLCGFCWHRRYPPALAAVGT